MGRISGRRGRFYVGVANEAATAEPLPFLTDWSISFETGKTDVTAMGDENKIYVSELPDSAGELSFFYDDATNQTYTAAIDGLPRKFYLYPSTATSTQYWFGTGLFDFTAQASVSGAVQGAAKWAAASKVQKVG